MQRNRMFRQINDYLWQCYDGGLLLSVVMGNTILEWEWTIQNEKGRILGIGKGSLYECQQAALDESQELHKPPVLLTAFTNSLKGTL